MTLKLTRHRVLSFGGAKHVSRKPRLTQLSYIAVLPVIASPAFFAGRGNPEEKQ
jgi:hypothetical protein